MKLDKIGKFAKIALVAGIASGMQSVETQTAQAGTDGKDQALEQASRLYTIDELAHIKTTLTERQMRAQTLFNYVQANFPERSDGSKEMLVYMNLNSEKVSVRVVIFPAAKEIRILVFRGKDLEGPAIALVDNNLSGSPSGYQLPIELDEIPRPQPFFIEGHHPIADSLYGGLLEALGRVF